MHSNYWQDFLNFISTPEGLFLSLVIALLLVLISLQVKSQRRVPETDCKDELQLLDDKMLLLGSDMRHFGTKISEHLTSLTTDEITTRSASNTRPVVNADTLEQQNTIKALKERIRSLADKQAALIDIQDKIALGARFCLYQDKTNKEAMALFCNDMFRRPENLVFGSAVNKFHIVMVRIMAKIPVEIINTCLIDELLNDIKGCDFLSCYQKELRKDILIGCWQRIFWKSFRAEKMIKLYWSNQILLLKIFSEFNRALKFVMSLKDIRIHEFNLLNYDFSSNAGLVEDINIGINPTLKKSRTFVSKIKPLTSQGTVFCDIAFWGIDEKNAANSWDVVYETRLVAIGKEYQW